MRNRLCVVVMRVRRSISDCSGLARGSSQGALRFCDKPWLEVLVETHNLPELEVAHRIGAEIIGVNNRNLVTSETDINTSLELSTFSRTSLFIFLSRLFLQVRMLPYVAPIF